MKGIAILGSTGSIGVQTLDIVRANKDLSVKSLAAGSNIELLEKQVREFKPEIVCVWEEENAKRLRDLLSDITNTGGTKIKVVSGMEGLILTAINENVQMVVVSVVGMIGVIPTIEAIKAKKDIALANKESLVTAGHIIMPLAKEYNVRILPVDSEHSAIFQSLKGEDKKDVSKILLTASGGPFRGKTLSQLKDIKVEDALKHPNWVMGKKITIDSATMINKGLEVIEARWLFDVEYDQIQVIVHPQSIIHSMVEYVDGSIIAQLGMPDMKLPIQYALVYPERRALEGSSVDFFKLGQCTFEEPDLEVFKGLRMAYAAGNIGGNMTTVYNAANERCVAKFLSNKIGFLEIANTIEYAMSQIPYIANPTIDQILETESIVYDLIESRC